MWRCGLAKSQNQPGTKEYVCDVERLHDPVIKASADVPLAPVAVVPL